ncbi:hypothetical protein SERLA73DRAFT_103748 [Serpula lacrymans var. lacrymans S7.3]|uniref:Cytochrome P450 n=1 Tax=Serpula lacrymans var. lacrymans (strain S7.3) TaxID=936435 RepID=F8PNN2_SERL3|nr:hypothetical protein SERLA73DRAFT_103748 [Serpula lacrymans var. lacrymans S7.3]
MTLPINWLDAFLAVLALFFVKKLIQKRPIHPLPPGPKGLPLVGNVLDVPSKTPWLTFAKWGDIFSIKEFGRQTIVINSASVALSMLEKKSLLYSNRPHLTLAGDLVGWNQSTAFLQYGVRFREYRKNLYRTIGSRASLEKYQTLIETKFHHFLRNVLNDPSDLAAHIRTAVGSIILRISHGYEAQNINDPYLKVADIAIHYFSITTTAGAFLVDIVPLLRYLPNWFPGTGFKAIARAGYESLKEMTDQPHEDVKEKMKTGTALHSFTSELLADRTVSAEEKHIIKWSAQTIYSGGADTTVAAIYAFFVAMTLFPEVQKKAQAEIDSVIDNNRLPTTDDREALPYVNAMVSEVLRWHSLAPLGGAHVAVEDDVHDGYFIPKGSLIVPNIWKMLHDPKTYRYPAEFDPERFIASEDKPAETDPRNVCFGFGRRICPGMVLAELSLFISCAMVLSVFDISKCVEDGVPITPEVGQTEGTISHPKPFKCSIRVRSEKALFLIQQDA